MDIVVLLLIGAVAGVMAGLLGIGGGVIVVPALAFLFERQGVSPAVVMQMAIGTSLAAIVFTSLSSIRAHHARGAVRWPAFWQLLPGILIGGLVGAAIAHGLSGKMLKVLFGGFILLVALQLAWKLAPVPHRPLPGRPLMLGWGGLIGALSSLFGIGGGTISVPFLMWCSVPTVQAIATAAAIGLPIALAGTAGYVLTGWNVAELPPGSLGYVALMPMLALAAASVLFAPLGARLAHRLQQLTLRRIFALFLTAVGLRLLLS
ncbi:MAG: sulfite exporter TauE/SafE family protein [Gammaproteobacteria bacterium]|nr:sulfite exporter TauE/SafE family protein [Gammaproteobacteria bacterium]